LSMGAVISSDDVLAFVRTAKVNTLLELHANILEVL
jgi:hypothetical protein